MKKYPWLLFSLFGISVFTIEFFVWLPILLYFLIYWSKSLFIFDIVNAQDNIILNWLGFLAPMTRIGVIVVMWIVSLAIAGIFSYKRRWYAILVLLSWLLLFSSVLFTVVKTYNYIPNFFTSVIAGSLLVIGGFASRYACFWWYKKRKFLPYRLPSLIWISSFLLFCGIIKYFPDPVISVDYSIYMWVEEEVVMTPRSLDTKEFVFAWWFLILLWICRYSFLSFLRFPLLPEQKSRYQRKILVTCLILWFLFLWWLIFSKKSIFTAPNYDLYQYDSILVKSGYKSDIATWENWFYLQNKWFMTHTGFLNNIEKDDFVRLNYFSQWVFVMTGFTIFWNIYSGWFRDEFIWVSDIASWYTMVNTHTADFPFPEEKLIERVHLANTVALALCRQGQCKEWFTYWKERAIFTQKRLNAGQGIMGTLISKISMQDVFSWAHELLSYLSIEQKQTVKDIIKPLDISKIFTNMLVQEYYFVYGMGVESIQKYMQESAISYPKFIFDSDFTNAQMKFYFGQAILNKGKDQEYDYSEKFSLTYNFKWNSLLWVLMPNVEKMYDRLYVLEQQRIDLISKFSE